jgi:quercetin dioxygenase-like cupin family protein
MGLEVVRRGSARTYEPERDWKRTSLCEERDISIEAFVKAPGHASPHHEHPSAQILIVTAGQLHVRADDEEQLLEEGDTVYIPGGARHTVTNPLDTPSEGLDIFVPGRSFDFWRKRGLK